MNYKVYLSDGINELLSKQFTRYFLYLNSAKYYQALLKNKLSNKEGFKNKALIIKKGAIIKGYYPL